MAIFLRKAELFISNWNATRNIVFAVGKHFFLKMCGSREVLETV